MTDNNGTERMSQSSTRQLHFAVLLFEVYTIIVATTPGQVS